MGRTPLTILVSLLVALSVGPATTLAKPHSDRTTFLLSRAWDGGFANGPSRAATVSHDQRFARWMAFESDATNLVEGDSNGVTDVFVVKRATGFTRKGDPWKPAGTTIASAGRGRVPANGRSYAPSLDGDSHHKPRCVAFISEASNLVPGDTNGVADAFVRDLYTGRVRRVSRDGGRQRTMPTTEVQIDGACERVAYVCADSGGVSQVYVHILDGEKHDAGLRGTTFVASTARSGRSMRRSANEISFARDGKSVAFVSGGQVWLRTFTRKFVHLGHGRGKQTLRFATRLVSARADGRPGNGASRHPAVSDTGRYVAFETDATDLFPHDRNGVADIARADMTGRRPVHVHVSRSEFSGRANGASRHPVISDAGEFVLFDSDATNLRPSATVREDRNGISDVFLWNANTGNVSLESRDSQNGYVAGAPAHDPATSSRGNYVPFESDAPPPELEMPPEEPQPERNFLDGVADILRPPPPKKPPPEPRPKPTTVYEPGAPAPASPQIFMRYLGPE